MDSVDFKIDLVSVIIPVYNRFSLADEAVTSVYDQTHRPIELIIVDDCSDGPYVPKFSSQPGFEVILIRHETNQGPGTSRETGRQAATGDFIAYLDSDDLWHPEKLEKQISMLEAHPEAGMCYTISVSFKELPLSGNDSIRKRSDESYSMFLPTILDGRPWGTSACLWTKHATDIIGPWVSSWAWEDIAYDCRAGCFDIRIAFLPEIMCYQRWDAGYFQLSKTDYKLSILQRAPAILKMAEDLSLYKKTQDPTISSWIESLLYKNCVTLLSYGEKNDSRKLLRHLLDIDNNLLTTLFYRFLYISHAILPPKCVSRLGKRFNPKNPTNLSTL
jgi:glycosyltransferase involved in cell wall biosynthesis